MYNSDYLKMASDKPKEKEIELVFRGAGSVMGEIIGKGFFFIYLLMYFGEINEEY